MWSSTEWLIEVISPDSTTFMQSCSSSDCVQSVGKSSFFFSILILMKLLFLWFVFFDNFAPKLLIPVRNSVQHWVWVCVSRMYLTFTFVSPYTPFTFYLVWSNSHYGSDCECQIVLLKAWKTKTLGRKVEILWAFFLDLNNKSKNEYNNKHIWESKVFTVNRCIYMKSGIFTRQRNQTGTIPSSKDNFKYWYRLKQQLLHISKK